MGPYRLTLKPWRLTNGAAEDSFHSVNAMKNQKEMLKPYGNILLITLSRNGRISYLFRIRVSLGGGHQFVDEKICLFLRI